MTNLAHEERPRAVAGIYPGLTRAEYESINAANFSTLKHFERSAAHAREAILHPPRPTPAMEFGTAVHAAILQPLLFRREYVAAPKCDRRTTDGKKAWSDFEAAHPRSTILDADIYATVLKMSASVWEHPTAKRMLAGPGHNEVAIVWEDADTGVMCKALVDRIGPFDGWTFVIDAKSTEDAGRFAFTRSIKTFHYSAQAAMYVDGCNVVAPRERRFAWIAVEKVPPYAVAVYEATDEALAAGRSKYRRWLRNYQDAIATDEWPAYSPEIWPLGAEDTEWRS